MDIGTRKRNIGILAHVDAGKTTLSEAVLFRSGQLRKLGRVDHGSAFLDSDVQERERGITIYSKQAEFTWEECCFTLVDTPGHADFSGETERTLSVLDAAVLVISGADGVQGHTRTLWRLLERYHVPVLLFVNKMDQNGTDAALRMTELKERLSENCADFSSPDWMEQAAAESEEALTAYLDTGTLPEELVQPLVAERKLFPCFFGSALKMDGVDELLSALVHYLPEKRYPEAFAARVYKITRDSQGQRLTWLKVTGGTLRVKETLRGESGGEPWEEKINQIRICSGERYQLAEEAAAGTVCAVTGLSRTRAGDALGAEQGTTLPFLEPVFAYQVRCGDNDPFTVLQKFRLLEEEEPQLHVVWNESLREIRVQLMGEVQLEILERLLADRFGMKITFGEGGILYKETITEVSEGVGHYEPLRHYAEVHLRLEPGERGSGLHFDSECSTDDLDLNWQRLVLTHLAEKEHKGVLIGAPLTDVKITLTAGRAHLKHTEGGDFRQATYRAVRHGIMSTNSILLDPWYDVRMELPANCAGRAMTDLQRMGGDFDPPETIGCEVILTGTAPVAEMRQYHRELTAYTRGQGRMSCTLRGYAPCRNAADVIAASGYEAERDTENPADSVFCSHGAGYVVPWREVREHMHLESTLRPVRETPEIAAPAVRSVPSGGAAMDKELQFIYERTYGKTKERAFVPRQERNVSAEPKYKAAPVPTGPEYLLVDGYNIIFAWDELKTVAADNLDAARQLLMDVLCNYQGVRGCVLILVFDAYRVPFHREEIFRYHNIHVVYTKEAETADAYIEKTTREIAKDHRVRVATSDGLEQLIILGGGALRMSADAFHGEVEQSGEEIRAALRALNKPARSEAVAAALRRAEKKKGADTTI